MFTATTFVVILTAFVVILTAFAVGYVIYEIVKNINSKKQIPIISKREIVNNNLVPKYTIDKSIIGAKLINSIGIDELKMLDTFVSNNRPMVYFMDNSGMQYIVGIGDYIGRYFSEIHDIKKDRVYIKTVFVDRKGNKYIHPKVIKRTNEKKGGE
jgi:Tfp pilus assembly protein PilP